MRIRDTEQKVFITELGGKSSGRFYMENLEMSARDWDKMTPGNETKSSRVHAGYTDGLGTCLGPRILMDLCLPVLSQQAEACGSPP
jgi:hypothetical protein